jgi:hypothetical protein
MKQLPDSSIHAVVTDPPYELGFMGKEWDKAGIAFNRDVWADYSKETARLFLASLSHGKKGKDIINSGGPYSTVSDADMIQVVGYFKDALKDGRQVEIKELNSFYAGLGDHFQNEFLTGLELYISGWDKRDWNTLLRGQATMNLWGSWYNKNIDAIRKSGP